MVSHQLCSWRVDQHRRLYCFLMQGNPTPDILKKHLSIVPHALNLLIHSLGHEYIFTSLNRPKLSLIHHFKRTCWPGPITLCSSPRPQPTHLSYPPFPTFLSSPQSPNIKMAEGETGAMYVQVQTSIVTVTLTLSGLSQSETCSYF